MSRRRNKRIYSEGYYARPPDFPRATGRCPHCQRPIHCGVYIQRVRNGKLKRDNFLSCPFCSRPLE